MTDEATVERVARAICEADGVDPDAEGYGMGVQMPEGERYPLWKARAKQARAALKTVGNLSDEALAIFRQAERDCTGPRDWVFHQAWRRLFGPTYGMSNVCQPQIKVAQDLCSNDDPVHNTVVR